MGNVTLTLNITGPEWAWYLLLCAAALASIALAAKSAVEAWGHWRVIKGMQEGK